MRKGRIEAASESAALAIGEALAQDEGLASLAVTWFEIPGTPGWLVEAYFGDEPFEGRLSASLARLPPGAGVPAFDTVEIADQDWAAKVQRDLHPVAAGRFLIHGRHDRERARAHRFAIEIDAGAAFGTAHHATTAGCLEAIERLARRYEFTSVLDLGCGTGVLAIAAAKVWPRARVVASDIDPVAVGIARSNARANGVAARIDTVVASGLDHAVLRGRRAFDLVLANILALPLQDLAPVLARSIKPGGRAVLAGLLVHQAGPLLAAYRAAGFMRCARRDRGEWTTLMLRRAR